MQHKQIQFVPFKNSDNYKYFYQLYCEIQKYLQKGFNIKIPHQGLIQRNNITIQPLQDDIQLLFAIVVHDFFDNVSYDNLPLSFDQREFLLTEAKDQYSCGACATFVCIENMEVAILSNYQYYYLNKAFANSTKQLKLSPTFVLDNSINSGKCYGNISYMRTMETFDNFPYKKGMKNDDFQPSVTKLNEQQFITPFKYSVTIENDTFTSNTNLLVIKEHDQQNTVPFTDIQVKQIKWLISRGIAVSGSMFTQVTTKDYIKFMEYKQGILHAKCDSTNIDHGIQFVGYGKYEGKDVFVIRNSWGQDFGMDGLFYVEIGANSYCIENEAASNIPQYYTKEEFQQSQPLNTSRVNKYVYQKEYKSRRGVDGLDNDDGTYQNKFLTDDRMFFVIFLVLVISVILITLCQFIVYKISIKRQQKRNQESQ